MNRLSTASFTNTALASIVLALGAFGCSSSTSPSGTTSGGDGGGSGETVTFSEVYTTVLQGNCSSHHAAGQEDSFLDLSSRSAAIASLVGVKASGPACGTTNDVRVVAGSPSTSLLYQKVSMSTPPCGAQMPFEAKPLSAADQQMISDWISQGAQDN